MSSGRDCRVEFFLCSPAGIVGVSQGLDGEEARLMKTSKSRGFDEDTTRIQTTANNRAEHFTWQGLDGEPMRGNEIAYRHGPRRHSPAERHNRHGERHGNGFRDRHELGALCNVSNPCVLVQYARILFTARGSARRFFASPGH